MPYLTLIGELPGPAQVPLWSRADLHNRIRTKSGRPVTDAGLTEARIDEFLTEAQSHWYTVFAPLVPEALYGPLRQLTTDDEGYTYHFGLDESGNPVVPMGHVELFTGPGMAEKLVPDVAQGHHGFIFDGQYVRWPRGKRRTFGQGLWGRYIAPPGHIDATHEPTLSPPHARILLVYHALALWADRTNQDPGKWFAQEKEAWAGNGVDTYGVLGALRTQYDLAGAQHLDGAEVPWWLGIDTGADYVRHD